MSRHKKQHWPELRELLQRYCLSRKLDFYAYGAYHMKIRDSGFTCISIWTTGKYFVEETNYSEIAGERSYERTDERGKLPRDKKKLGRWLDGLFYGADMVADKAVA